MTKLRAGTWRGFGFAKSEGGSLPAHQIQLLQTFADQAVIAIENARLFNETQEALERQTATSEILRVISQSPTDAEPVFKSIVSAAVRSLRCDLAVVLLCDGDVYEHTAAATAQGPMDLPPGRLPISPCLQLSFPGDRRQGDASPSGLVAYRTARTRTHI